MAQCSRAGEGSSTKGQHRPGRRGLFAARVLPWMQSALPPDEAGWTLGDGTEGRRKHALTAGRRKQFVACVQAATRLGRRTATVTACRQGACGSTAEHLAGRMCGDDAWMRQQDQHNQKLCDQVTVQVCESGGVAAGSLDVRANCSVSEHRCAAVSLGFRVGAHRQELA